MATIVLGAQWGNESGWQNRQPKGKLLEGLSSKSKISARAVAEHNGGISISSNKKTFNFKLLPVGLVSSSSLGLIGASTAINARELFAEISNLETAGLESIQGRLLISDRALISLDLHSTIDALEAADLGTSKAGTAASRSGITVADVFDVEGFEAAVRKTHTVYKKRYGDAFEYDVEDELKRFEEYRAELAALVVDATSLMKQAQDPGAPILIEGGSILTDQASAGGLGGAFSSLALNPLKIKEIIGVVKAYTTRDENGPFPTEITKQIPTNIIEAERHTSVNRRIGWLDLVAVKYTASINHYTSLNLTKLDVLDGIDTIKVAIGYKDKATGQDIPSFPANPTQLASVKPVYQELPGWTTKSAKGAQTFYDLPLNAREYINFIEKYVGVKVKWVGVGPEVDAMMYRGN